MNVKTKPITRFFEAALGFASIATLAWAEPVTYRSADDIHAIVTGMNRSMGGQMRVRSIGTSDEGRSIDAVRIGYPPTKESGGAEDLGEDPSKPVLLIECGMHAREWASPELCLRFLEALSGMWDAGGSDQDRIEEILTSATIWMIPLVNPDGRARDGEDDPTARWTSTEYHADDVAGWRGNVQDVECNHADDTEATNVGIDLNRNFSSGWWDNCDTTTGRCDESANAEDQRHRCESVTFRGEAPFQAPEARALRQFVNNHMVSMSLSVHSFHGSFGAPLSASIQIRDTAKDIWNSVVTRSEAELTDTSPGGAGYGQFTAWMTEPSDVPGDVDEGTTRGANAFLLELPPHGDGYPARYQNRADDGSNEFHPSDETYFDDVEDAFVEALLYLAAQGRSPWCAIDPATLSPTACSNEVGLTGAKIALNPWNPGLLRDDPGGDSGREALYVPSGGSKVRAHWRVQNFDVSSPRKVGVRVTVENQAVGSDAGFVTVQDTVRNFRPLGAAVAATGATEFLVLPGYRYRVTIQLVDPTTGAARSDSISENDTRVLRFTGGIR